MTSSGGDWGVTEPVFDLERGRIAFGSEPHVLIPTSALIAICATAGESAARELGRAVGRSMGHRLSSGPAGQPSAEFATAIDALGAELGWLGLGGVVAERWGEIVVLRFEASPVSEAPDVDALLSGIVEGSIEAWTCRTAHALVIDRRPGGIRVLVGGARAVGRAQALVQAGASHIEVIQRLHEAEADDPRGAP